MNLSAMLKVRLAATSVVAALALVAFTPTACKCQDAEPEAKSTYVKLTPEQAQAINVDRIRFNLKTPDDYSKEAYLAIDEDNVKTEFEELRREIEAEVATPNGVPGVAEPAATPE